MASAEMCPNCMIGLKPQRLNFTEVMLKCSTCFFPLDSEDVSRYIIPADDPRLAAPPAPRKRRREQSVSDSSPSQLPGATPASARKKRRSTSTRRTSSAAVATPSASPAPIRMVQPQPALSLDHHSSSDIDSLLSGLLDFDDTAMAPSTNAFDDAFSSPSSLQHYPQTSLSPDVDSSGSSSSFLASTHTDLPAAGTLSEDALREFLFFDIGGADHDGANGAAAANTTNGTMVVDLDNLDSLLAVDELASVNSPPGNTATCDEAHLGRQSDDQRGTAVGRACVVAPSPSAWSSA